MRRRKRKTTFGKHWGLATKLFQHL